METGDSTIPMEQKWFYEIRSQRVVDNLRKNNIDADYVSTGTEALDRIKELIPQDATIGLGDSETAWTIFRNHDDMSRFRNQLSSIPGIITNDFLVSLGIAKVDFALPTDDAAVVCPPDPDPFRMQGFLIE